MPNEEQDINWLGVIARSLAYLCLKNSDCHDKPLLEQAAFLERLGLPAQDRAGIIDSTPESLRVLAHQASKKNGGKRSGKEKRR